MSSTGSLVVARGCSWRFDSPTALDDCCGTNVTLTVVGTVTSQTICGTTHTRTWRATDCCSNSITCSQTVTVAGQTLPTVSIVQAGQTVTVTWTGPGHLEAADTIGPGAIWMPVSTTSPFITSTMHGEQRFFRVVCP